MRNLVSIFLVAFSLCSLSPQVSANLTPVYVSEVQRTNITDEIEALGSLQANENVDITSTVTERIVAIYFEDNQRVSKGDLLVEMDSTEEEAELAEERSRLEEAKRQINRIKPLVEQGVTSDSALDAQQREVNTALARIRAIESRIQERKITAPFDGVVGIRNISVGALAQPGTLITTIDDISVMKMDFSIPEVFLASLKTGINVRATTSAYPEKVFNGAVSGIDSRVNLNTRAVLARALIDNADGLLKAGMLMQIELDKNPRSALVIPEEALISRGERNFVFVVNYENDKSVIEQREVFIASRRKGEAEIYSGLIEGEHIVTHGTLRVRNNMEVAVRAIERGDESLAELLQQTDGAPRA